MTVNKISRRDFFKNVAAVTAASAFPLPRIFSIENGNLIRDQDLILHEPLVLSGSDYLEVSNCRIMPSDRFSGDTLIRIEGEADTFLHDNFIDCRNRDILVFHLVDSCNCTIVNNRFRNLGSASFRFKSAYKSPLIELYEGRLS